jgi:hypothetical protein
MTPTGGFAMAQSFACTGLPGGWSCSFSPASLSGTTPQSTIITVGAMSAAQMSALRSGMQTALVWPFPVIAVGPRRSRRRRERASLVRRVLGALALTALALAGCGGSGSESGSGSAETGGSQTYTVTVTAARSNAAAQSAQFTLTVTS